MDYAVLGSLKTLLHHSSQLAVRLELKMLFLLLLIPFVSASADYDVQIVTQYLQTYGYLTHDNKTVSSIGVGGNSSAFQEALIKFQDFFRIEATGELDNETITIMKKP
ncbi:hypothetical protein HHI36_006240 [Cryptolaemus montrouzieri]|uniref:Peptidoglycan binding-like domain-containing protein n=1 Tax=Cryptolaemus montrouzieri TaxID=559131 RepID=A0ABD2NWQ1_9CUCU